MSFIVAPVVLVVRVVVFVLPVVQLLLLFARVGAELIRVVGIRAVLAEPLYSCEEEQELDDRENEDYNPDDEYDGSDDEGQL